MAQVKLCDPSLTRAVAECLRDGASCIKHYITSAVLLYLLYSLPSVNPQCPQLKLGR